MRDLRFVGVSDESTHLYLVDEDGVQHQVEVDDELRAAVRSVRPASTTGGVDPNVRPKDVQSMLRSGLTIEEVAERTGWTTTKVGLFEPPIRAERDHVALTAQRLSLHSRVNGRDRVTTVGERVGERLSHRGVPAQDISWEAWRGDRGWTIECRFPAGGRDRVATWRYDAPTQSLHPIDDEARWLSEDDQAPANLPFGQSPTTAGVYDVVAEGGLDQSGPIRRPPRASVPKIPHAAVTESATDTSTEDEPVAPTSASGDEHDSPVDLVSVMRERSKNRRRKPRKPAQEAEQADAGKAATAAHSVQHEADKSEPETVDDLGHDPVTGTVDLFGLHDAPPLATGSTDSTPDSQDEPDAELHPDIEPGLVEDEVEEDSVDGASDQTPDDTDDLVPERPSQSRKGRPAVPSWDDIMFGKRGPKG